MVFWDNLEKYTVRGSFVLTEYSLSRCRCLYSLFQSVAPAIFTQIFFENIDKQPFNAILNYIYIHLSWLLTAAKGQCERVSDFLECVLLHVLFTVECFS